VLIQIRRDIDFVRPAITGPQHIVRKGDVTLNEDYSIDFNEPGDGLTLGPLGGIGSQDFLDDDLGIDFGDRAPLGGIEDDSMEVEIGRRDTEMLRSARQSMEAASQLGGNDVDLERLSERSEGHPTFGDDSFDPGFGDDDLGITFDLPVLPDIDPATDREKTPGQFREDSRACKHHVGEFDGSNL
jgi:cohesin complex subunit SCC1